MKMTDTIKQAEASVQAKASSAVDAVKADVAAVKAGGFWARVKAFFSSLFSRL